MVKLGWAALATCVSLASAVAAQTPPADPPAAAWRDVDPADMVLMDTSYGQVVFELAPAFAPKAAERFRALARAHFYDGQSFYRVVDGFVAQGGIGEGTAATGGKAGDDARLKAWPPLRHEFERKIGADTPFTPLGSPDLFAPEAGHVNGFTAGRDPKDGEVWMAECPGVLAFARDDDPDTASTEFYVVIGQAPRRLDRNMSAFGRVLSGMEYLQKLKRGDRDVAAGVIQPPAHGDPILKVVVAADLPPVQRPHFQVLRTESEAFAMQKADHRALSGPFWFRKGPIANDLCEVHVPVRRLDRPPAG